MCYSNKDEVTQESLESFTIPQTLRKQRGPADSSIHTYQYSGNARGKSAASRWHLASLLLPLAGVEPPGHAEDKEPDHAAALLS